GVVGAAECGRGEALPGQQVAFARLALALAVEDARRGDGRQAHAVADEQDDVLRLAAERTARGRLRRAMAEPPLGRLAFGTLDLRDRDRRLWRSGRRHRGRWCRQGGTGAQQGGGDAGQAWCKGAAHGGPRWAGWVIITRAWARGSLSSTDVPSGIPMKFVTAWFRVPFWQRVLAGFVLGALAGWAFGPAADTWFGPLGDLYVTLLKMIAVPLVFFAVIHAVSSLHGQRSMVALGGRTFAWFAGTAVLAVSVGLLVGTVMQPGVGVGALSVSSDYVPKVVPDPIRVLLDVVPANP